MWLTTFSRWKSEHPITSCKYAHDHAYIIRLVSKVIRLQNRKPMQRIPNDLSSGQWQQHPLLEKERKTFIIVHPVVSETMLVKAVPKNINSINIHISCKASLVKICYTRCNGYHFTWFTFHFRSRNCKCSAVLKWLKV